MASPYEDILKVLKKGNENGWTFLYQTEYLKYPVHKDYYNKPLPDLREIPDITGCSFICGSNIKDTNLKIYVLDIDVYKNNNELLSQLLDLEVFKNKNVYCEKTTSNGYHIIFLSEGLIMGKHLFRLRDSTSEKYNIEFFGRGNYHVLVAPSLAIKKNSDEIGCYEKISDIDLFDTCTIDVHELFEELKNKFDYKQSIKNNLDSNQSSVNIFTVREDLEKESGFDFNYIDRRIKDLFPDIVDVFHYMKIKYINNKSYVGFYSLLCDDGHFYGAASYRNDNKYFSIVDFHTTQKTYTLARYLFHSRKQIFDNILEMISLADKKECKIQLEYNGPNIFNIDYKKYINPDSIDILLNQLGSKTVICAPTGSGKTNLAYHLMKKDTVILTAPLILQVVQGETSNPNLVALYGNQHIFTTDQSIVCTFNKSKTILENSSNTHLKNSILIIDEAHDLSSNRLFKRDAIDNLLKLSKKCKKIIYITATPQFINKKEITDMIYFNNSQKRIDKNKITVVTYDPKKKSVASSVANLAAKLHKKNKIDIIYIKNKEKIEKIKEYLKIINENLNIEILTSDNKHTSQIFNNLQTKKHINHESNITFNNNDGILLVTNLFVEGVNVLDKNIGNVFMINIETPTDLRQFPARFRNGYDDFFVIVSNTKPKNINILNAESLVYKYYSYAEEEKREYEMWKHDFELIQKVGWIRKSRIDRLVDNEHEEVVSTFMFLNNEGEICDFKVLYCVQNEIGNRLQWDRDYRYKFLTDIYEFTEVYECDDDELCENKITSLEIQKTNQALRNAKEQIQIDIINILKTDEEKDFLDEYEDYKKGNKNRLYVYINILLSPYTTNIVDRYLIAKNVMGASNPLMALSLTESVFKIALNGFEYFKHDKNRVRIQEIMRFIEYQRASLNPENAILNEYQQRETPMYRDVVLNRNFLNNLMKHLKNNLFVFKKYSLRNLIDDIKSIYDTTYDTNSSNYTAKKRWHLGNIYGLICE